jgi:hypothetical protein
MVRRGRLVLSGAALTSPGTRKRCDKPSRYAELNVRAYGVSHASDAGDR